MQNAYRPPTAFSTFPPVIKNVLIINALVFFAQIVPPTNDVLRIFFALWPLESGLFRPWQLVTYGFLHDTSSLMHIGFNMFALWMFGVEIENTWGSRRFGLYYFVCVIGAALAHMAFGGGSYVVGASGGVYGVLLAFGMMFPDRELLIFPFPAPIKAKYLVIGYGAMELLSGISGARTGVAHWAHLGGMVIGLFLILYWRGRLPLKPHSRMHG